MAENFSLVLPEDQMLEKEIKEKNNVPKEELTQLEKQSEKFIENLLAVNQEYPDERDKAVSNVDQLGINIQKKSALNSENLKVSVQTISDKSSDGEKVANSLLELKSTVEELDPGGIDFSNRKKGLFNIFDPVKKYIDKIESLLSP